MRTSMPASSSILATPSTFGRRGLVKTSLMPSPFGPDRRACLGVLHHPDQAFLHGTGDQLSVAIEYLATGQAAAVLGTRAVDRIQQPVVGAERAMEPQCMVERGHLHVRLVVADAVREGRGAEQVEVGGVGEQGTVQFRRVADSLRQTEPDLLIRRALRRVELITRIDVAELERPLPRQP